MKKTIFGVVAGTVVFFVWGMTSWMFLPWHTNTIKTLPEEQLITDTLKTVISEPGYYAFPSMTHNGEAMDRKAFAEKSAAGPVGAIIFKPEGNAMNARMVLVGLVSNFGIALVGMLLLLLTRDRVRTFFHRALLVASLGVVVGLATHISYWNWMGFPSDFTAVSFLDSIVTFFLMGLAQAPFVPRD